MRTILSSFALYALVSAVVRRADPRPSLPVLTVARAETAPKLDADPADPAWTKAPALPGLSLTIGADPGDEALPTEVRLLWDAHFLYVRFYVPPVGHRCALRQSRPAPLQSRYRRSLSRSVVGDGRQYFEIEVSPKNQIFDALFTLTTEPRANENGRLLPEVINRNLWNSVDWKLRRLAHHHSPSNDGHRRDHRLDRRPGATRGSPAPPVGADQIRATDLAGASAALPLDGTLRRSRSAQPPIDCDVVGNGGERLPAHLAWGDGFSEAGEVSGESRQVRGSARLLVALEPGILPSKHYPHLAPD